MQLTSLEDIQNYQSYPLSVLLSMLMLTLPLSVIWGAWPTGLSGSRRPLMCSNPVMCMRACVCVLRLIVIHQNQDTCPRLMMYGKRYWNTKSWDHRHYYYYYYFEKATYSLFYPKQVLVYCCATELVYLLATLELQQTIQNLRKSNLIMWHLTSSSYKVN